MSIETMKGWVISAYPYPQWKEKVRRMPDDQIIAIYYKLLRQGAFDKPKEKHNVDKESYAYKAKQLSIFDMPIREY